MISQEQYEKAMAALQAFGGVINKNDAIEMIDKAAYNRLKVTLTGILKEGLKPEEVPIATTESEQPSEPEEEVTGRSKIFDRLTPAERTTQLNEVLRNLAVSRSVLGGLIRQGDKTVISLNSPTEYRQAVWNITTRDRETVKLVFGTASAAYLLTENANKQLSISQAKFWVAKDPNAKTA